MMTTRTATFNVLATEIIEGNSIRIKAELLQDYDPDRVTDPVHFIRVSSRVALALGIYEGAHITLTVTK